MQETMRNRRIAVFVMDTLGNAKLPLLLAGDQRPAILDDISTKTNTFTPLEKIGLLDELLTGIGTNSMYWSKDRKQGAVELLLSTDLTDIPSETMGRLYEKALRAQILQPKPEGNIDPLITAGHILSSHLDTERLKTTLETWHVVSQMLFKEGDKLNASKVAHFMQEMRNLSITQAKTLETKDGEKPEPEWLKAQYVKEVQALRASGKNNREITKALGISGHLVEQITKLLFKKGATVNVRLLRMRQRRETFIAQVQKLHQQGKTQDQIAAELGVPSSRVNSAVDKLLEEDKILDRANRARRHDAAIAAMKRAGMPSSEIMSRLGITRDQLERAITRNRKKASYEQTLTQAAKDASVVVFTARSQKKPDKDLVFV